MNYSFAAPAAPAIAPNVASSVSSNISHFLTSFWAVALVVLIVFALLVIYYKTVGYYLDFGWKRIGELIGGRESVKMQVGEDGMGGTLRPMDGPSMDSPPKSHLPPPSERTPGLPGAIESAGGGLFNSLSIGGPGHEVFNVSRNVYTYSDASAVCSAFGAELATYDQVKTAYEKGADWCNYGWTKGQMAVYPTQKETYDKLQKGAPEYRNACGNVGINGGYFDNPELRFGVNCFGVKPAKNATDELEQSGVQLPASPAEIEYEKKVQKYREQMATTTVLPFRRDQWTE
jgi:hypothetical protein